MVDLADRRAAPKSTWFRALALTAAGAAFCAFLPARAQTPEATAPAAEAAKAGEGGHAGHSGHMMGAPAAPACLDPLPRCAPTAEPAFARDGTLWLVFPVGDKVYVASSRDAGASFSPAVIAATVTGAVIDANGEARPKIAALPNGTLLVSYTARPEKSYDGAISLVRSTDGGKTFSAPEPLLDSIGQRFDIFLVSPKGRLYAAWLDKRDAAAAKQAGEVFAGSGIAVGWSDDGGKSWSLGIQVVIEDPSQAEMIRPTGTPNVCCNLLAKKNATAETLVLILLTGRQVTAGGFLRSSNRADDRSWAMIT